MKSRGRQSRAISLITGRARASGVECRIFGDTLGTGEREGEGGVSGSSETTSGSVWFNHGALEAASRRV